jgi:1,4-dihydroxy-6-naphthoate synthase
MHITIGFSPCPNDTFIFDALVNNRIDTGEFSFTPVLEDVQTLNEWAVAGKLALTKLSYGVLPLVLEQYRVLNSGSALGKAVGPLLIGQSALPTTTTITHQLVAIPGEHTTAHLLFNYKYPNASNKIFMRYDAIEDFVLSGKGLGVIIHENRFTYADKGLHKWADLGEHWEHTTRMHIPLGGIVVKKDIPLYIQQKIDQLIQQSIAYAFDQYPILNTYVKEHAQEMDEQVMRQHINLYVNNFSMQLGHTGKAAVLQLLQQYNQMHGGTQLLNDQIFVPTQD